MSYCSNCGKKLDTSDKFCSNCGKNTVNNKKPLLEPVFSYFINNKKKIRNISLLTLLVVVSVGAYKPVKWWYNNYQYKLEKERKEKQAEAAIQERIRLNKRINDKWVTFIDKDPASGEEYYSHTYVGSENGICELSVDHRINGRKLISFGCVDQRIIDYYPVEYKFDSSATSSSTLKFKAFSNSRFVYVAKGPSSFPSLVYKDLMKGFKNNSSVAFRYKIGNRSTGELSNWVRFTLSGASEAIEKLGKPVE
jgi:hypothetical protein